MHPNVELDLIRFLHPSCPEVPGRKAGAAMISREGGIIKDVGKNQLR